jgi:uncharacterized membrane protein YeaQ/YmgE (transglycosylase-associated protein family)
MELLSTIITLVSGIVGGNIAGPLMTDKNLGPLVNSIAGLVGGGAGQFILKALGVVTAAGATAQGAAGGSELDLTQILSSIGVGGVSGGALTAIVTALKDAFQKK